MADYHSYVFNQEKRTFVGEFEQMYENEDKLNFDSWHQEDSRQLARLICLDIMSFYNFNSIVDIGSGKGAFTHLMKKRNNEILALDISRLALDKLEARYPDIQTEMLDVNDIESLGKILTSGSGFDLAVSSETISYTEKYPEIINLLSKNVKYCLINLYIPDNPIGFVKSAEELETLFEEKFNIEYSVNIKSEQKHILFGKSKHIN